MLHDSHILIDCITRFIALNDIYSYQARNQAYICLIDWFSPDPDEDTHEREFKDAVLRFLEISMSRATRPETGSKTEGGPS